MRVRDWLLSGLVLGLACAAPVRAQMIAGAPEEARRHACTRGLPALAFVEPRARVLAVGRAAADVALACAEHGGTHQLDVVEVSQEAWARIERGSTLTGSTSVSLIEGTARARARAVATSDERYDVILLAPEAPTDPRSFLDAARPRIATETVEGLHELLRALGTKGALFALVRGEPLALRFALSASDALALHGAQRPPARFLVQRGQDRYGLLVSPSAIDVDTVLALHDRDLRRRESAAQPTIVELPAWAGTPPELLHSPSAVFDNRYSRILVEHAGALPNAEIGAYAFDLGPVRDDRPLFFERTRVDVPGTWPRSGAYRNALLGLALVLAALLALGVGVARRAARARGGGSALIAASLGLGLSQGTLLAWCMHASARVVADAERGVAAAGLGLLAGGVVATLAARRIHAWRREPLGLIAAFALAAALLPGALRLSHAASVLHTAIPVAQLPALVALGTFVLGALSALSGYPTASAVARGARSIGASAAACHVAGALAAVTVIAAATVLFADARWLSAISALSALVAAASARRAAVTSA